MTGYADRREKGRILCHKLAEAVASIAPKGISHWDRCWEVVDGPGAEYMLALTSWERSPSDEAAMAVSSAYDEVLDAWRQAAVEYATERAS